MAMEGQSWASIIVARVWDWRRPLSGVNGIVGFSLSGMVRALSRAIVGTPRWCVIGENYWCAAQQRR